MRKTYKWKLIASEKEILSKVSVSEKDILWRDHFKREGITIELSVVSKEEYLELSRTLSEEEIQNYRELIVPEKEVP
jgi:hypothetical protein